MSAKVLEPSLYDTPYAESARHVEEDYGIRRLKAEFKGAAVIAIQDPGIALNKVLDRFMPFGFWRFYPAWLPVNSIQMYYGDTQERAKLGGQDGLARTSRTNDNDALHR